jgi:hypothetical protein
VGRRLEQLGKSLREMIVIRQDFGNLLTLHREHRNAVAVTVFLVGSGFIKEVIAVSVSRFTLRQKSHCIIIIFAIRPLVRTERAGIPVIIGAAQSEPASVAYRVYEQARAEKPDVLLIDSAKRLQLIDLRARTRNLPWAKV